MFEWKFCAANGYKCSCSHANPEKDDQSRFCPSRVGNFNTNDYSGLPRVMELSGKNKIFSGSGKSHANVREFWMDSNVATLLLLRQFDTTGNVQFRWDFRSGGYISKYQLEITLLFWMSKFHIYQSDFCSVCLLL